MNFVGNDGQSEP